MPVPTELYLAYLATIGAISAAPAGPGRVPMISTGLAHRIRGSAATAARNLAADLLQMTTADLLALRAPGIRRC